MPGLQSIKAAFSHAQVLAHPHSREMIVATQERWLERRTSVVPNIRKALTAALAQNQDLSGRPLIKEEEAWLRQGLGITDRLDRENRRTRYVIPDATFAESLTLYLGSREIEFRHLGAAHTAGDILMWLPQDGIVATGDIVTGPIPLMPSPYAHDYVRVLERLKTLGFKSLIPGHGPVERDSTYVALLIDTIRSVSTQMSALVARGLSQEDAVAKVDLWGLEQRFNHGDPFLANRFQDYVTTSALPAGAYLVETGKGPNEAF